MNSKVYLGFVIAALMMFFLGHTYIDVLPSLTPKTHRPEVTTYATLAAVAAILMAGLALPGRWLLAAFLNIVAGLFSFQALIHVDITTTGHLLVLSVLIVGAFSAIKEKSLFWVEVATAVYLLLLTAGWHVNL